MRNLIEILKKNDMATLNKQFFDKQYLLDFSDNGYNFYEFVLEDLRLVEQGRCENVLNPFYGDKKPGLSIFLKGEMWRFHDHGDSSYSGSVFDFAALHYGLEIRKDFKKIIENMYYDLGIDPVNKTTEIDDMVYELGYIFQDDPRNDEIALNEAYRYFKQFKISKEVLRRFGVTALTSSIFYINKEGELKEWGVSRNQISILYNDINHCKLYRPGADKFKFQYFGNKSHDFVFGQKEIVRDMHQTKRSDRDILIIAAGEKDVLTLTSLGYDAISLNSETVTNIPLQLENSIINCYNSIVVLYDLDETGKKSAKALQKRYGFKTCELPKELIDRGGKDVSDYVRLGMDLEKLQTEINNAAREMVLVHSPKKFTRLIRFYTGYLNSQGEEINNIQIEETAHNNLIAENNLDTNEQEPTIENPVTEVQPSKVLVLPTLNIIEEAQTIFETTTSIKSSSPFFPDTIFAQLPEPFQSMCAKFEDKRERDIILFSGLAVASSLFPTLKSINDGRMIGPNLNLFISAPAASGKGTANWAKRLGNGIQKHLKEKHKIELAKFMNAMQSGKKKKGDGEVVEELVEPVRQSLFIPANNSVSKVYEMLGANQKFGIIFETEGDTLTGALKAEWGNFSDVIRKCFHHETISLARRMDDELIEVENPHLSVLLTGTPLQINNLIQSVENGFFSRFGFYDFEAEVVWKSQFKKDDASLHNYFESLSEQFYLKWIRHENCLDTLVRITDDQKELVDKYFANKLHILHKEHGNDIVASTNRSCMIWQRIAMTLSALRYLESNKQLPKELFIADIDSHIAIKIVDVMLSHLQIVFARMKGSSVSFQLNPQQLKVWQSLPIEFDRKEFDTAIKDLNIEYKTGEKYLRDYIKRNILERYKHGSYHKKN